MKIEGTIIDTVTFNSSYDNFTGSSWQEAYFQLLSWKNTYQEVYKLDVYSHFYPQACIELVVDREKADETEEMLKNLGYGNIFREDTKTLVIDTYWLEDNEIDSISPYSQSCEQISILKEMQEDEKG